MPLQFVTPSGAPFKMDGASRPKSVAKPKKIPEDFHNGFVAIGFSPEHLRTAEASHTKRRVDALRLHAEGNAHVKVPPPLGPRSLPAQRQAGAGRAPIRLAPGRRGSGGHAAEIGLGERLRHGAQA